MGKDSQKPILAAPCMTCIQAAHASQSPLASRCLYDGEHPVTPGIFLVIQKLCFLCLVCPLSPGRKHFSLEEIAIHHKHWLIGKALRLTANFENVKFDSLPNNARQFLKISMYGHVAQYQSTSFLYKWPQHHIKSNHLSAYLIFQPLNYLFPRKLQLIQILLTCKYYINY